MMADTITYMYYYLQVSLESAFDHKFENHKIIIFEKNNYLYFYQLSHAKLGYLRPFR